MRYLLIIIIFLCTKFTSHSQLYFKTSDSIITHHKNIKKTYLNFYPEIEDGEFKDINFDFIFFDIQSKTKSNKYNPETVLNYGLGLDYNYDLNDNEVIDFSLMIDTALSNFSLNSIKFSIIFYL
jgi:hypothetical protein